MSATACERCSGCDIANGCPEFCRCKPANKTNDLPSVGTETERLALTAALGYVERNTPQLVRDEIRTLVSERDALAGRVAELEAALWGCIAAIERTHHCTEEDRLASAEAARAAISAKKGQS